MKNIQVQLLVLVLLVAVCFGNSHGHTHAHKKKHHSYKKNSKRSLSSDEVNYDEFASGSQSSSKRLKRLSKNKEEEKTNEFDDQYLTNYKKVIKV